MSQDVKVGQVWVGDVTKSVNTIIEVRDDLVIVNSSAGVIEISIPQLMTWYSLRASPKNEVKVNHELRDHFAGLAMQALVTGMETWKTYDSVATDAYEIADAMLKARGE